MSVIDHAKAALHFECEELKTKNAKLIAALIGSYIRVIAPTGDEDVSKLAVAIMLLEEMDRAGVVGTDKLRSMIARSTPKWPLLD